MINSVLVSIHFPKAAGSSLRHQLERHLGDALMLDYTHDPLGLRGSDTVDQLPSNFRAVHGHFRALRYAALKQAFHFTFLREPVENLISIYYFWRYFRSQDNPWHDRFLQEKPSIEEFAAYGPLKSLMAETYFGGFDMRRMNFVGFYESRELDVPRLGDFLGLPMHAHLHVNPTSLSEERMDLMSDVGTLGRLRSLLADDVRFYEHQRSAA